MVGHATVECVDREKTYDTVPGDMATVTWMEVPEPEPEIVAAMYEEITGRNAFGARMSERLPVNIDLKPGYNSYINNL